MGYCIYIYGSRGDNCKGDDDEDGDEDKDEALMELRSVIARAVTEFDVSFAPGEDGTALLEDSLDTFTIALAPLMLVFTKIRERFEDQVKVKLVDSSVSNE
jgi:hypothetical protein